jgi:hypothetical protein
LTGTVLSIAIAALVAWFLVRTSVKIALATLLATTFVIPGSVLVPGSSTGYTTVHRIVLGIFILNILRKIARKELPAAVLQPSKPTVALTAWVILTFAIGVAMADTSYPVGAATFLWVFVVEYALFFVFVVAAIRAIGDPWWVARLVSTVIVGTAGIAVYEHFSGVSVGRMLARLLRGGGGYLGVSPLGRRGGDVRVQAGFDFALAYAWAATALLPLVVVVASRARTVVFRFLPGLLVFAIAWTYARSAYAGVAAAAVMILLISRFDRTIAMYVVGGLAAALLVAVGTQAYQRTFASSEIRGSTLVREERLPLILSSAAQRPLTGKGLGSVAASGVRTTDSLFLLTYAEIGVLGVGGLIFLLIATLVWITPGLRAPPPDHLIGAACVCGVVLGILSGAFLDVLSVSGSARAFWLIAAIGTVVAERAPEKVVPRRRLAYRAAVPAAGVLAGLVILAATPTSAAITLRFTTRSSQSEAAAGAPSDFIGKVLVNTACEIIEVRVAALGNDGQCTDLQSGNGVADVRIEAPDRVSLARATIVAATVIRRRLPTVRFFTLDSDPKVRPTYAETAPVWLGLAGLAIAILSPPLPPFPGRPGRRPARVRVAAEA